MTMLQKEVQCAIKCASVSFDYTTAKLQLYEYLLRVAEELHRGIY